MDLSDEFSVLKRKSVVDKIFNTNFDIVIIGGGITGAGILLDAVTRGYSAILLEKDDFGSGTSSRSSKLIHGGLRYLKNLEFAMVRHVGRERNVVYKNAAHLVYPERMILPVLKGKGMGYLMVKFALTMYDFLADVAKPERHKMLNKDMTNKVLNNVILNNLVAAGMYTEYKTDDARLTMELLKTAVSKGGVALNYAKATEFLYNHKKVSGLVFSDVLIDKKVTINAKYVVSATGPWTDVVRQMDTTINNKSIYLTKGIHIVVNKSAMPIKQSVYFSGSDSRMLFAIPRFNKVYIGTTDTVFTNNPDSVMADVSDIDYVINAINELVQDYKISRADVVSVWAGLRPLMYESGKKPSQISRKDEVLISESGVISIAGGKLTGYRLMAKRVVDLIVKIDNKTKLPCITKHLKLSGAAFDFLPETHKLVEFADAKYDLAKQTQILPEAFKTLFYRYGTNIDMVTEKAFAYYNASKNSNEAWLKAELWFSVNYEMCATISDFLIRRTSAVLFFPETISEIIPIISKELCVLYQLPNSKALEFEREFYLEWQHYKVPWIN